MGENRREFFFFLQWWTRWLILLPPTEIGKIKVNLEITNLTHKRNLTFHIVNLFSLIEYSSKAKHSIRINTLCDYDLGKHQMSGSREYFFNEHYEKKVVEIFRVSKVHGWSKMIYHLLVKSKICWKIISNANCWASFN